MMLSEVLGQSRVVRFSVVRWLPIEFTMRSCSLVHVALANAQPLRHWHTAYSVQHHTGLTLVVSAALVHDFQQVIMPTSSRSALEKIHRADMRNQSRLTRSAYTPNQT